MPSPRPVSLRSGIRMTAAAALVGGLAAAGIAGFATGAAADPLCTDRNTFLRTLAERYREAPRSMGLSADGAMVEVLVSTAGTWTIMVTRPDGLSCLVASGEDWENLPQVAKGPNV